MEVPTRAIASALSVAQVEGFSDGLRGSGQCGDNHHDLRERGNGLRVSRTFLVLSVGMSNSLFGLSHPPWDAILVLEIGRIECCFQSPFFPRHKYEIHN